MVGQHNALMDASQWTIGGLLGFKRYRDAEKAAIEKATFWAGEDAAHRPGR